MRDQHDQRTYRGKKKSIEQTKKQNPEGGHHSGPELGMRFDAQSA